MQESYDYIIIGGGIIGLSIANEIKKRYSNSTICIIEKESKPGLHASGRNSGVLHSGIYYGPETLKAKVCARGAAKLLEFAEEHNIQYRQSGKIIVASDENDLPVLEKLLQNARENKIDAEKIDEQQAREIEPHAYTYNYALYTPTTAVINSKEVVDKLFNLLRKSGVVFKLNNRVCGFDIKRKSVYTDNCNYTYGYLINAAGFNSDRIAKQFGLACDYTLLPFKGIYSLLREDKTHLVRSNIYPAPDLSLPFLGVHLTRLIDNKVYIGPTAIPAFGRENYHFLSGLRPGESLYNLYQIISMYISNQHSFRRLFHKETKKLRKKYFYLDVKKLVPDIRYEDILPSRKVGIRPQLVNTKTKKLEMDYIYERTEDSLHILNAISPAFTSAFAFSELIVDMLDN